MLCCTFICSSQHCSWIGAAIARQQLGPSCGWLWKWLPWASANPTRRSLRKLGPLKAATLVTCNPGPLGRTDRLSSEPADLAGILHASSLFATTQLFFSLHFSSKHRGRSAGRMCGGLGVLSCRIAEGEEGRKVFREILAQQ